MRERAVARGETEFSGWAETSEFCDRFVPQKVSASCNSHGVVTIRWKAARGADNYDIVGANFPDGVGDRTEIHVQRNEGETHEFQVLAHTAGDWGDPSDPLNPPAPGQTQCSGYSDCRWLSPNAVRHSQGGTEHYHNPVLLRYVTSDTINPALGRDNCTDPKRNVGPGATGFTRTCTYYWTESLMIDFTQQEVNILGYHTGLANPHLNGWGHLHKTADGDASLAVHRHCPTNDVNGDGDTDDPVDNDGTCPGPDTAVPDMAWHPDLPGPGDPWWKNQLKNEITTGAASGLASLLTARLIMGAAAGPAFVVGTVVGIAVGFFVAWLNSRDSAYDLVIDGVSGCLHNDVYSGDHDWVPKSQTVYHQPKTEAGFTTIVKHEITYCVPKD